MVYVNDVLEGIVNIDKNTQFEVSKIIINRGMANDIKEYLNMSKAELMYDKYDGMIFNKNMTTVTMEDLDIYKLEKVPCVVMDLLTPDFDENTSLVLFATNI